MPFRKTPLVENYVYHVCNRGVNHVPIFNDARDYQRIVSLIDYCRHADYPQKFSLFKNLAFDIRKQIRANLKDKFVNLVAYTLMPNHFHLVIRQTKENGITSFMNRLFTSYTKFFNIRHERSGPLFEGRFKAVLIETDEQLDHVVRYVHLNPYTSGIASSLEKLLSYPWSSFQEYLNPHLFPVFCDDKEIILTHFKSSDKFKQFTLDQADYQKALDQIKHLTNE